MTDFDGKVASQLSGESPAASFGVFVFGRNGELLQRWDDVPSAQELAAVIKIVTFSIPRYAGIDLGPTAIRTMPVARA